MTPAAAALLAHCVSFGVNALYEKGDRYGGPGVSVHGVQRRLVQADRLARAVGLDMVDAGWRPTVDNYLGRVTKPRILEAVREAKGEQSAQLIDHLKKAEMAKEAERLLDGTGWLPEPLRTSEAAGADATDADAAERRRSAARLSRRRRGRRRRRRDRRAGRDRRRVTDLERGGVNRPAHLTIQPTHSARPSRRAISFQETIMTTSSDAREHRSPIGTKLQSRPSSCRTASTRPRYSMPSRPPASRSSSSASTATATAAKSKTWR